jgi:hypothetical protein
MMSLVSKDGLICRKLLGQRHRPRPGPEHGPAGEKSGTVLVPRS